MSGMTQPAFRNTLLKLMALDHAEMPFLSPLEWSLFRPNPVQFFVRADDATADRIWAALEARP